MPPGPRAGFSMCVHKRRALLFGGVVDMEVEGKYFHTMNGIHYCTPSLLFFFFGGGGGCTLTCDPRKLNAYRKKEAYLYWKGHDHDRLRIDD